MPLSALSPLYLPVTDSASSLTVRVNSTMALRVLRIASVVVRMDVVAEVLVILIVYSATW